MNARLVVALLSAALICACASAYAAAAGTTSGLVDIDIKNVPVRQAIATIFEGKGLRYIIEPGVTGRVVELKLKGITVAEALRSLGDAAGFTVSMEEGVYIIGPVPAAVVEQPVERPTVAARPAPAPAPLRARPTPAPMPIEAPPVTVNNFIPGGYGDPYAIAPAAYDNWGGGWNYGGLYSPFFTVGPPPYIIGQWPNPPPPRGWFSPDVERFLRFEWAVPKRPSFITPY